MEQSKEAFFPQWGVEVWAKQEQRSDHGSPQTPVQAAGVRAGLRGRDLAEHPFPPPSESFSSYYYLQIL